MRYKSIIHTLPLSLIFIACGGVSNRNITELQNSDNKVKIAQYIYQNRNYVHQNHKSIQSRAYPGAAKNSNFDPNTYYFTKSGIQINGETIIKLSKSIRTGVRTGDIQENHTTIKTDKKHYKGWESITVNVKGMLGDYEDWIGVYYAGDNNDWDNVVTWSWTDGIKKGEITLEGVEPGQYEVRAFFENSFNDVATSSFTVDDEEYQNNNEQNDNQNINDNNQIDQNDNIQDDSNNQNNGGVVEENNDAQENIVNSIIYEDANHGISNKWQTILGPYKAKAIKGVLKLTTNWITDKYNDAEYQLPMNDNAHKTLELDIGGLGKAGGHVGGIHKNSKAGFMPHYVIGVYVTTKYGSRVMIWDSWFNHVGINAFKADYGEGNIWLNYPSPIELVRGYDIQNDINRWDHFKVNLNSYLKQLEPGNKIISVDTFLATGGYLDNIKLSNN